MRPFLWTHHRDPMSAKPRGGGKLLSNTQENPASVVSSPHKSPRKSVLLHGFFVKTSLKSCSVEKFEIKTKMYERLPWASGFSTLSASAVHSCSNR